LLWTKENKKKYIETAKWKVVELDPSALTQESDGSGKRRDNLLPLTECLRLYSVQEQLGVDDKWYCPDCKDHVQAFKKIEIWSPPRILIVHLKRFNFRGRYHFRDRLDHLVDFPLDGLDLSQYVLGPTPGPPIYDLFAVSNHYGSMGGGHYTAFAKHIQNGKWFLFDDSSVREVSDLSSIVSEAAYLLLYRRRDLPWPSSFRVAGADATEDEEDSDDADSDDEEAAPALASTVAPAGADPEHAPAAAAGTEPELALPVAPAGAGLGDDAPSAVPASPTLEDATIISSPVVLK